jgi:hypothetical protein
MKKSTLICLLLTMMVGFVKAQDLKRKNVPTIVQAALAKKYHEATKVSWEKKRRGIMKLTGAESLERIIPQYSLRRDICGVRKGNSDNWLTCGSRTICCSALQRR